VFGELLDKSSTTRTDVTIVTLPDATLGAKIEESLKLASLRRKLALR
jgi:hypothetical protein